MQQAHFLTALTRQRPCPRTLAEANGHRADERLRLDDLYMATEIVALTLLDLLEAPK